MRLIRTGLTALALWLCAAQIPAIAQGTAGSGTLRIAVGTSINNLDPARTTTGEEYIYTNLLFNGLTRMTETLEVVPDLAEKWSYSADLKSWTFNLRRGVKFHNGREMVAADVVKTFERILDPATGAAPRSNYEMVEKIVAVDSHTVRFDLKTPYGGFADIMTDRQVKIVPADLVAELPTKPVGTGPFTIVSSPPGDRMVLTRNADYYEAGLPKLAGLELRIIPEMAVRIAALQAGDLDIIWELPPEQVEELRKNANLRVESVPTASWDAAILNNAIAPFNDPRVRKALHMAIDKRDLVELALFGHGTPTHSPIPPNHPFFNKGVQVTKADPAGAKRLLAQAGHPNGIKVPLVIPVGRPVRERLGVAIQQLARPGGFDIEIQRVPFARYNAEVSGKAPMYIDGYFARPTLDTGIYPWYHSKGSWNARLWHFSSPRIDELLDRARLTGATSEQGPLFVKFQEYAAEDLPGLIAYAVNFVCAYRKEVQGMSTHPMRWFDVRNATVAR